MKRLRFRPAYLVVFGVLCLVGIYFLTGDRDHQPPEATATIAGFSPPLDTPVVPARPAAPYYAPAIVPEEHGHIEIVSAPQFDFQPLVGADTDAHSEMRLDLGEIGKLRFAAHNKASPLPAGAKVTASVLHGSDPVQQLDVEKVAEGVYDVPFTPQGPGQFNVVLSVDGARVGSERVGVVGTVGASDAKANADPLSAVDVLPSRARSARRGRR